MAADISKVEIGGPCRVTYKGIVLGHTLDGVEITVDRQFTEVNADQFGETPIDYVLSGNHLQAKFNMAQTEYDQWNAALPEAAAYDGVGVKDRIGIGADAGYSLRQDAGPLVIHPMKNADSDLSDDVTLYLAVSTEPLMLPVKIDEQRVLEVTFNALVSEDYGNGRRLGHYGPADVS